MLDNLSTGFRLGGAERGAVRGRRYRRPALATSSPRHRVNAIIHFAASIVVPDSVRDPLGYYRNNTMNSRMLIECAVKDGVKQFHLFLDRSGIRQSAGDRRCARMRRTPPISPYGSSKLMTEIMLHDTSRAHDLRLRRPALLQRCRRRSAGPHRPVDRGRHAPDQGRCRDRARAAAQNRRLRHRLSDAGRHLHPRLHPCQRSRARAFRRARLSAPRRRHRHVQLRLWPRRSVLEVIDAVKRASGRDFRSRSRRVGRAIRRRSSPSARIRSTLDWRPQFDDLATIVGHALAWERSFAEARRCRV